MAARATLFTLLGTGLKKVDMGGFQHADTKNVVSFFPIYVISRSSNKVQPKNTEGYQLCDNFPFMHKHLYKTETSTNLQFFNYYSS